MNIVIFAYRPDSTDICRGCVMGSTESDMEYGVFDSTDDASSFMADYMAFNETADAHEYADYEFTVIINGVDIEDIEPEDFDVRGLYVQLKINAEMKSNAIVKLETEQKARDVAQAKKDEEERIRQQELATLARLREKHNQ